MSVQLRIYTADRALEVMNWLEQHVSPRLPQNPGTIVYGEGWNIQAKMFGGEMYYVVELDDNIDERTQLLFTIGFSA